MPLWMWEEKDQIELFGHVRILGDVWCYYKIVWPWS